MVHDFLSWQDLPSVSDFKVVNQAAEARDPDELEMLSRNKDENVRARVAENIHTSMETLEALSQDTHYVRLYLIRNKMIPYSLLKKMAENTENMPQTYVFRLYERILEKFKEGKEELPGGELYNMLKILSPKSTNLELVELMESIYVIRDKKRLKQNDRT